MVKQSLAQKDICKSQYKDSSHYLLRDFNFESHNITRSINKKPPNPIGTLKKKTKR